MAPALEAYSSLYFIKTKDVKKDAIEVIATDPAGNYSHQRGDYESGYGVSDRDNGVFRVGGAGLYFMKIRNTGSGSIELHRTTTASNYKDFDIHTGTVFGLPDADNGVWTEDYGDLYFIKTRNCGSGMIEIHRVNPSNPSVFTLHIATSIPQSEGQNGTWNMYNGDLYFIRYRNIPGNDVEVWYLAADKAFQGEILKFRTWFNVRDGDAGTWQIGSNRDLYFIKTRDCGTKKIEVHIASFHSHYQKVNHIGTWIPEAEGPNGTWCVR